MIRTIVVSSTAMVAVGVLMSAPASAVPTCATQAEYEAVEIGMTKAQVHNLFDGYPGEISYVHETPPWAYDRRYYDHCGKDKEIVIRYRNRTDDSNDPWRVYHKDLEQMP